MQVELQLALMTCEGNGTVADGHNIEAFGIPADLQTDGLQVKVYSIRATKST